MGKLSIFITAVLIFTGCQSAPTRTTDSGVPDVPAAVREITPAEAQVEVSKAYSQFVDVRTPEEYASGHAARAINIPLDTLNANLDRLETNEPIYFICESGNRSKIAAEKLREAGFNNVSSVAGGTAAWKAAGLPMETKAPHGAAKEK
jgi:rhodanese-related sulfurtransferase